MGDEFLEASAIVESTFLPSKLIRSLSSKLRRFGRRDNVAQETRAECVPAASDDWLPFDPCHMIRCFGLQGKVVRQACEASPETAEDGRLTRAGKDCLTVGVPPSEHCVDVDEANVGLNSHGIAEMHTHSLSRYEIPGGPIVNSTNTCNRWLRDEVVDYHKTSSFNWEEITGPMRETMMTNPGQLGPSKLIEESLSGRQQCGCSVNSSIGMLKKECGSRKIERAEKRESIPTSFTDGNSSLTEQGQPGLPDDVMELCLARMSFSTLARARTVCRKWRDLTMSPHFLVSRENLLSRKPWLLLFGLSRNGISRGEIHALDTSLNQWHSIQADILSGRFLFSVASLNGLVYVLGGCSSLSNGDGKLGKGTLKTHKGVLVYNPFTYSWTTGCSMVFARAMAVTGVFEIKDGGMVRGTSKSQMIESCQCEGLGSKKDASFIASCKFEIGEKGEFCNLGETAVGSMISQTATLNHSCKNAGEAGGGWERSETQAKRNGLIVVGGQGLWNQPLYSAEVYNPFTNTWREVARLPADHGITCAGVVCNGFFYAYSETDKLAAYDFDLNIWIRIQVSNTLTRLHEYIPKLVSCKEKLILFGVAWGSRDRATDNVANGTRNDAESATRMLWEFHPTSQTWQEFAKHPDAPLDWNAISVCEGNQIYGLEMFKIFGQVLDFVTVCDLSGSEAIWKRMSRMRLGNDLDVSSCITKMAVVVQL